MRRLIIDDRKRFPFPIEDNIVYCRAAEPARGLLRDGSWDEVWLDYKLVSSTDDDSVVLPEDRTTEEIVKWWVNSLNLVDVKKVVICTRTPQGAEWLERRLKKFYPIEFCRSDDEAIYFFGNHGLPDIVWGSNR